MVFIPLLLYKQKLILFHSPTSKPRILQSFFVLRKTSHAGNFVRLIGVRQLRLIKIKLIKMERQQFFTEMIPVNLLFQLWHFSNVMLTVTLGLRVFSLHEIKGRIMSVNK